MGIVDKIEEIRRKPEHIRMRYVWFFVFISMILVLTIWFFSMQGQMKQIPSSIGPVQDLGDAAEQFNQQKDSLRDVMDSAKNSFTDEAINDMQTAGQNQIMRENQQ